MNKLYNNYEQVSSNLKQFFTNINISIPTYKLDFFVELIISIILAESGVISDISKKTFSYNHIQDESIHKKIRRLFDSKTFNSYDIFDSIVNFIIDNYTIKHDNNSLHITIDHMYCRDKFATLMFTLRIGKQSIPLWYRCFKGQYNPDAFKEELIIEGINYIYNLFKSKNSNIIFLADRWFPNSNVLSHINNLNCTYVFRAKSETKIKYFDKDEGHYIWKQIKEFNHIKGRSKVLQNVEYTVSNPIKTNIVLGRSNDVKEPWVLITNGNTSDAVRNYSHRFGAIECNFKNNKSNGFYIEDTKIQKISSFEGMYLLVNIATLWLTIIGVDYSKNKNKYAKKLKIRDTKKTKSGHIKRIISFFNLGLTIFNKLLNSTIDLRLKCNFILYDI